MTNAERERLEMSGYLWGNQPVCYRNADWTDEQYEAFHKGYDDYKRLKGENES